MGIKNILDFDSKLKKYHLRFLYIRNKKKEK